MPDYEKLERVAIKVDSGINEKEAIKQTEREYSTPECIARLKAHQDRVKLDRAEKHSKNIRRFEYR